MIAWTTAALSITLLSALTVWGVRRWALHNLLDVPNDRSSHQAPTPKGGGVAILVLTLLPFGGMLAVRMPGASPYWFYVVAALLIGVLGWLDDRYEIGAWVRLRWQFLAALAVALTTGGFREVGLSPSPSLAVALPSWVAVGLAVVWVVALTNMYNFMDGIDGLAAAQAIVAAVGWGAAGYHTGQPLIFALAVFVGASSVGFIYWNRPRAKIFMGDVGSTFLGFTFAALPLLFYRETGAPSALPLGFVFVLPFVLDAATTIIWRAVHRKNLLEPHRDHLYQRLVRAGCTHHRVTGLYTLFMLAALAVGLRGML